MAQRLSYEAVVDKYFFCCYFLYLYSLIFRASQANEYRTQHCENHGLDEANQKLKAHHEDAHHNA